MIAIEISPPVIRASVPVVRGHRVRRYGVAAVADGRHLQSPQGEAVRDPNFGSTKNETAGDFGVRRHDSISRMKYIRTGGCTLNPGRTWELSHALRLPI